MAETQGSLTAKFVPYDARLMLDTKAAAEMLSISVVDFRKLGIKAKERNGKEFYSMDDLVQFVDDAVEIAQFENSPKIDFKALSGEVVYFIEIVGRDDSPIKIGFSSNLKGRVDTIQTSSPWQVRVLFAYPGSRKKEQRLHFKFAHLRMKGEWFKREPELTAYIARLKRRRKNG